MLQRILVGLDGSAVSETILPFVTTLAHATGAAITLVQVLHLPDDFREMEAAGALEPVLQQGERTAAAYLSRIAQHLSSTGLAVDRLGDVLSVEVFSLAMYQRIDALAALLAEQRDEVCHPPNSTQPR